MLPAGTSIGHVHLTVADLSSATHFYGDVLGFRVAHEAPSAVFLSADGHLPYLLILSERPGAQPRTRRVAGLYHFAILLPSRADLGRVLRHLLEAGSYLQGASDHGVSEALYMADPEGNGIEIYADRGRERWTFHSGALVMPTRPMDVDDVLQAGEGHWVGMPAGTRIGHIHLQVSDLGRAEAFYAGVLGFDVMVRTYPGALFVAAGGYHHHIGLNIWAGTHLAPAPRDGVGLRAFAVRLPDRAELARVLTRVREAGVAVDAAVDHGVGTAVHLRDPDGIGVALWVDGRDGTGWAGRQIDVTDLLSIPPQVTPI